jgi:radical SAM superfamily enzyme YgiQ (UPF0313 family)
MLATLIKKCGISTRVLYPKTLKDIRKIIEKHNPKIVGVSCETANYPTAKKIPDIINSVAEKIFTIIGGRHATFCDDEALKDGYNCVVRGEGEITMLELAKAILNRRPIKDIKGISYTENKKTIRTPQRPLISNLDELPFPDWSLSDCKPPKGYGTIYGTRGCTFDCHFCVITKFYGRTCRQRSADSIVSEIIKNKYKVVIFNDDNFTSDKARITMLWNLIKEFDLDLDIVVLCRMDTIAKDPKIAEILCNMGVRLVNFGVESFSEIGLKYVNKSLLVNQQKRAAKILRDLGIEMWPSIMLLPIDTEKTWRKTVTFTKETINPKISIVNICTPFPGTALRQELIAENRLLHNEWKFYDGIHCVFKPLHASVQLFEEIHKWGDRYLNNNFTMKCIVNFLKFLPYNLRYTLLTNFFNKMRSWKLKL